MAVYIHCLQQSTMTKIHSYSIFHKVSMPNTLFGLNLATSLAYAQPITHYSCVVTRFIASHVWLSGAFMRAHIPSPTGPIQMHPPILHIQESSQVLIW